ncbi:MAG: EAL domain-containing protein [Thiovulaceae bacterium]|nr:EAL domain-containing protein [Sulfurimonadaceae bacterium]
MDNDSLLYQYKDAVDASSIFSKTGVDGRITYVNERFCKITGYSKNELLGRNHSILRHPDMPAKVFESMWKTISSGNIWQGVIKNKKKDGTSYYVNSTIYPIKDEEGKILEYISIRQDITEVIKNKKLLAFYSTDQVTLLPNRQKLLEKLNNNSTELMSIILDIKDMSLINELYGEEIGDEILYKVSLLLKEYIANDNVTLYKLPVDQYLILVEDKNLFEKYRSLIEFTFLSEDNFIVNDIVINFTIGIAYGLQELLSQTSLALKEAKKRHKGFYVYDKIIDTKELHLRNIRQLTTFKEALEDGRIEPFLQPIVDAHSHVIIKYEALARVIDNTGNILETKDFLDIARKSSSFNSFTKQILQKSFAISMQAQVQISVNLTYENIHSTELFNYIETRLKMHTGPKITFEILESEEIEDYEVLNNFIKMVKNYGAQIAIDDFGSGYSNFSHLLKFDADFIKIDGSIINNIETDDNAKMILSLIVAYAKMANIKTIAEYVRSQEIADIVTEAGVDLLQGYRFGKAENVIHYNLY